MCQYYRVGGLSKLLGVGQEFHKLALLPENYNVKWCIGCKLMFTCKRSMDGSFHSEKKVQKKTLVFLITSMVHQRIDSFPHWHEQFQQIIVCHMHYVIFLFKITFLHWFLCISSNQLSTVSVSGMRQITILEYTCRAEPGSCWFGINWYCRLLIFFLHNFNSLTWVPQSKMTRLQGDSRLSGHRQKQSMKK